MVRNLSFVAVLALALAAVTVKPAPAIDFICTCQVCHGGTGPACRDLSSGHGGFTSCSAWWAVHSSQC